MRGTSEYNEDAAHSREDDNVIEDLHDPDVKEEKLKVVVRVRPLQKSEKGWEHMSNHELEQSTAASSSQSVPITSLSIKENHVMWEKSGQMKLLIADAVFSGDAPQKTVFQSVEDCVDALFAGFDCSVFAYGQTGTGKTYTMSGLNHADLSNDSFALHDEYGIVPRSIEKLFTYIEKEQAASEGASFGVYCSFIEIYNEKIYDILAPDPASQSTEKKRNTADGALLHRSGWNCAQAPKETPSLHIRQKSDGSVFVDGLTSRNVNSKKEMLQAFREGSLNREVRDNLYNQYSSRGHSVFQITLRKNTSTTSACDDTAEGRRKRNLSNPNGLKSRLSRLFLIDLAGSEKWHVNGSDLSNKYASELSSINKSLSALTNCVMALTQKDRPHIPFRDSVLTRLLQRCLQGTGRTAFIVTISPAKESMEESFATLRFAERLKTLRCRPVRRKLFSSELGGEQRLYYEQQIQMMRAEVNRLRVLLRKAHLKNISGLNESPTAAANSALVEENRRLKELLMHSERSRLVERGERMNARGGIGSDGKSRSNTKTIKQVTAAHILSPRSSAALETDSQYPDSETQTAFARIVPSNPILSRQEKQESFLPRVISGMGAQGIKTEDENSTHEHQNARIESQHQLDSLVSELHSRETRLNWMLEIEMGAQNTETEDHVPIQTETKDHNSQEASKNSTALSTITRSWAVETRLRRNLAAVPTPVRSEPSSTAVFSALGGTEQPQELSKYGKVIQSPSRSFTMDHLGTERPSHSGDKSRRSEQEDILDKHSSAIKVDVTRKPTKPSDKPSSSNVSSTRASRNTHESASNAMLSTDPSKELSSTSILKLVHTGATDKTGKSKDELVNDYKRARRAELEAMLRTMVQ